MSRRLHRTVVVTVVAVRVVQVSVHQVIGMVSVRHAFVAAAGTVLVRLGVPAAIMGGGTARRVGRVHLKPMFFHPGLGLMMHVAVVQVIDMAFVLDTGVAAAGRMLVGVTGVRGRSGRHGSISYVN
jgi:hypothetical protein